MKLQIIAIIITTLMLPMIVAMSATPNITEGYKTEMDTTQVKHINQQNKSL